MAAYVQVKGSLDMRMKPVKRLACLLALFCGSPLACSASAEQMTTSEESTPAQHSIVEPSANLEGVSSPKPYIIDTDMAVDDWFAIIYLLQNPKVDVKAITVTGAGEAHCAQGVQYALELLALSNKRGVAVACGRNNSYEGGHLFPDPWREDVDRLLGLTLPAPLEAPSSLTAAELIETTVKAYRNQITVLATGPMTNLADALHAAPSIKNEIRMVYAMGGAVGVEGNVHASVQTIDNEVAEWNIYADPLAADYVLKSGVRLTLVPLDATNRVPLNTEFELSLSEDHGAPCAEFMHSVLGKKEEFVKSEGWFFWDPLAAAISADESLATIQDMRISIVLGPETHSGQTRADAEGMPIRVAVDANEPRFKETFLKALRRGN